MSGLSRRALGIWAAAVLAGCLAGCGGGASTDLARVGTVKISAARVAHWVSVMQGAGDPSASGSAGLRPRSLAFLISAESLFGQARELGVGVSPSEVAHQISLRAYAAREKLPYEGLPKTGEVPALFASRAATAADRQWLMELAILERKLDARRSSIASGQISHAEVVAYFNGHRHQFTVPERRDVEWIVTYELDKLAKAVKEIRAGANFVAVAQRVSLDDPTIIGLELATSPEKEFARHVFAARPHVIEGPFIQVQNHYVLEVTKVTPARPQTLAEAEAKVRDTLAAHRQEAMAATARRTVESRTACVHGVTVYGCGHAVTLL